ncbi:MAG: hypothetical protein M1812_006176 [Candelaria pacifica]|nr:MAG: hypothetical protein M1812_006176 [Candelaria pacifica]
MLSLSLTLSSALAVGASAFLIPSTVPSADEAFEGLNQFGVDPHHQVLRLECPGCSFAQSNEKGGFDWVDNVANSLVLDFKAGRQNQDSPESLMLNGVPFYPINLGIPQPLTAPQLRSDISLSDVEGTEPSNLGLSYTMETHAAPVVAENQGHEIVEIQLHIVALDNQAVDVDTVTLTILNPKDDAKDSMMIARVGTLHEESKPTDDDSPEVQECTRSPLICKWEAIIKSKLRGLKASANNLKESAKGIKNPIKGCHFPKKEWEKIKSGHHHEGPHGPYHPHNRHHRHHRHHGVRGVFHKIARVVMHVVVPIFIGIAAGITASLFGMAIGHLMVLCWVQFKRGGKKNPYTSVEQGEPEQDVFPEEKQGLATDGDLPKYQEVEVVTVSDEKA